MSLALAWSGGKDSALALHALRAAGREPTVLLTTVTEGVERVSIHGVRRALLHAQAAATGIALVEVRIPLPCPNEVYEARMEAALAAPPLDGRHTGRLRRPVLGGRTRVSRAAPRAERPQRAVPALGEGHARARARVRAQLRAVIATVDPRSLDASFAGRAYDAELLRDLPPTVDPCGENGEFHTFVHGGPVFETDLAVETGETVTRDGFVYADIVPAAQAAA